VWNKLILRLLDKERFRKGVSHLLTNGDQCTESMLYKNESGNL